ncbi:hypothetical protein [Nonomuraea jiangxiensis]|uniref:Uncharacterized protein n=1 Tax=Nonomuraea jiangxiensis TaxID=633440 RepID=A0A1G8JYX3_9ACTN|nr:hypothetical protein [Nonomuraea jiangxiensis]SDI36343.1 hypothetical protein SAMN05421869_105226 [Nonomuraea jiangxiensis]
MDHTRKMWASAAVVGVIVAAGVSIAAAASAGKLEEARAVVEKAPPTARPSDSKTDDDDIVVSTEVNPDPAKVFEYWTNSRMEDAQPMPMPSADRLRLPE